MSRYARELSNMQTAATLRLMRYAIRAACARDRHDWLTVADLRTSTDDCRIALRAAMQVAS